MHSAAKGHLQRNCVGGGCGRTCSKTHRDERVAPSAAHATTAETELRVASSSHAWSNIRNLIHLFWLKGEQIRIHKHSYSRKMFFFLIVSLFLATTAYGFVPTTRLSTRTKLSMMTAKEGDSVPTVTFKARVRDESIGGSNPFDWKDVTTEDLFKGKRVVLFALPGGMWFITNKHNLKFIWT